MHYTNKFNRAQIDLFSHYILVNLIQVAVLSDQIESASDKIGDMEKLLDDKKEVRQNNLLK